MKLSHLRALISAVDHGSFLAASDTTGTSHATLRSRVAALEADVGRPLLLRNSTGVQPTEAGAWLVEQGRRLVREADTLSARMAGPLPTGPLRQLRLCGPVGLPPVAVALGMSLLRQLQPGLEVRLTHERDPVRSASDDTDVILHLGPSPPRGPFLTTTLLRPPFGAMASADYLAAHGTPSSPEELTAHPLLACSFPGSDPRSWPLATGGALTVHPWLISNDIGAVRAAVAGGQGIGLLPMGPAPADGPTLVPVLEDVLQGEVVARALIREEHARSPRCRAVIDMMRRMSETWFGTWEGEALGLQSAG